MVSVKNLTILGVICIYQASYIVVESDRVLNPKYTSLFFVRFDPLLSILEMRSRPRLLG